MTPAKQAEDSPNPYDHAMNLALKFLGPRGRSTVEVRDRLHRSQVPEATVEEVLGRLEELQLLNDSELASDFADRARARGESSSRIRSGLKSRGLSEEPGRVDSLPEAESARALELAQSRARALRSLPPQVAHRRLAAYLARRGYGFEVVDKVCRIALSPQDSDD